jgi:hypothetical protein
MVITVISLVCMAVVMSGCTGSQIGTETPTGSQATQGGTGLSPGPTDVVPDYNAVTVDVGEKQYDGTIPVTFQGGMGQIHVKKIEAKLTRTDGTTEAKTIGANKGDSAELQGTRGEPGLRGQPDRVEVFVTMDNGHTYKVADVLREYRTRG